MIVGPQQMRGHPAPRPPGLARASSSPWRRAACADRRRGAPPPARRDRRPARRRHCRGRTADRCRRSTGRCRAARSAPRAPGRPPSCRRASRSMWPLEIALPISLIVLIFGRDRPSRASLSLRAQPHRIVVERIEGREQPGADRRGAGGRKLLAADDRAQPGIAALAAAQRGHAGFFGNRLPARILRGEGADAGFADRPGCG